MMDNIPDLFNKYKLSLGSVIGAISLCWGVWSYADSYFAHAADVKEVSKQISDIKKSMLDDKIFELEFKQQNTPKLFSPLDNALLERYKRQLKESN